MEKNNLGSPILEEIGNEIEKLKIVQSIIKINHQELQMLNMKKV